ncbi:MAG: gliding motility-associated C-terminal domain-containing protein [Chitinophagaceae bacterium]|nr:gliding motility-associated C-terminal domain-containing protein [Chitinophagaceae bacterium]
MTVLLVLAGFVSAQAQAPTYSQTICSGAALGFAPGGSPSSLTYTWGVPIISPAGSVNATPQATPQTSVNQTLTNSTTAIATVTYNVTASDASTFKLVVTVNPKPVLTNSTATTAICTGTTFVYTSASATAGTAITWSRALSVGIAPNTSSGNGSISEALTNTTTTPLTATYAISLTANGCNNVQNLSVLVNPLPALNSSTTPPDVCSGSNFSYSPSSDQSPNVNFSWTRAVVAGISNGAGSGTNSPEETLTNTTLSVKAVSYVYSMQNIATGCAATQTVTVNVNPLPVLSSSTTNVIMCSGATFNYVPTSALGGTSISWTRSSPPEISPNSGLGNGNISEVLVSSDHLNQFTTTYNFTLSKLGCSNTQSFNVAVNPSPILSSTYPYAPSVCSGNTFTYIPTSGQSNITFAWSRAAVGGISNSAASGTGNPNEALTNTTLLPVTVNYAYTLTNGVTGCSNTQTLFLIVNPIPSIASPINVSTCNSNGFTIYPGSAPVGTTYTWPTPVVAPVGAVNGAAAQSVGLQYVGQGLSNNTGAAATVTYTVTPQTFGCIGSTFTVNVTVNTGAPPSISLSSSLTPPDICSGTTFSYTPTSTSPGPAFSWQRLYSAGISNPVTSGNNGISEVLVNTTTLPVTVQYLYTISSGGCASSQVVSVNVNPATQLNTTLTPSPICSNTVFSYAPGSNTPSTVSYVWVRASVAGISNTAASGNGNPNETLVNTTNAPITVNYDYTLSTSATPACTNTQTVSVIVNPKPTLTSTLSPAAICSGAQFTYVPSSSTAGTIFNWTRNSVTNISNPTQTGTDDPAEILVNIGTTPVVATYNYVLTANTCTNTQSVTVTVKPVPVITSQTAAICSGTNFTVAPTGVPAGTQYSWPAPVSVPGGVVTGGAFANSQSAISQTLSNITTDPGILYYTVTPVANGCTGLDFVTAVTVNPIPVASNQTVAAICSGNSFSYSPPGIQTGTTYTWSIPVMNPAFSITGGSAQSNQLSIGQSLTNVTTAAASAVYTVTPIANGCTGNNFTVTVPVNPIPIIGNKATSICSSNTFTVAPGGVPAGTTYTWSTPLASPFGSVTGGAQRITPSVNISEFLVNTTTNSAQLLYSVTPIAGTCAGDSFAIAATVNPATQLSSSLTPAGVCSNTVFSYTPASNTASTNTFSWTRPAVAGISNGAASGTGNPSEVLINTTNAAVTVNYNYTLITTAGCTNNEVVQVVVNPTPVLTSSLTPAAICSGGIFNYAASSSTTGVVFSWIRTTVPGISNTQATGASNVSETLINTSISTVPVGYYYTLTANGCSNNQTVILSVKPVPVVAAQTAIICSNNQFTISPTGVPSGTQYSWGAPVSNPLGVVSGNAAANQNNISQTLVNSTISPAVVTYTVTPATSGCTGNNFSVAVTVNPIPVVNDVVLPAVCSGVAFNYSPAGVPAGTTYAWNNPLVNPASGLLGGSAQTGQASVNQLLTSANNIVNTALYTVTPTANGCAGSSFQLTQQVNPTPAVSAQSVAICSGSSFSVVPSPVPAGVTYTWATPSQAPFGSISGAVGQAVPVTTISQTLNNTTTAPGQAVYTVTPTAGACAGTPFTIAVTVNPGTQLNISTSAPAICSNTVFSYSAASNTPGTTLQWTRAAVSGISNIAATGLNNPNEILINTSNQPVNVQYVYNLSTQQGCTNTQTVTVSVKPVPVLNSAILTPAVCSGSRFNYAPTSNVAGASFNWTRAVQAFVSNVAASGINDPNEILVNTSLTQVQVAYTYTVSASSCSSQQVILVPVDPTPNLGTQSISICSNTSFDFSPANVPNGTTYTWANPVYTPAGSLTGGLSQLTAAASISGQLSSQTLAPATAAYTVTPKAGNCVAVPFTFNVTVQPIPTVSSQTITAVCSGTAFNFASIAAPVGTLYTWSNPLLQPAGSLTGGSAQSVGQLSVSQVLSSSNNVANAASYAVTPVFNGCTGNIFTLTVPVNPTPVVADVADTVCTGTPIIVNPTPVPINTRYTWGTPTIAPFGALIGYSSQVVPSGNINQTLINTTNAPAIARYVITPIAGNCAGASFALVANVGSPLPVFADQVTQICSRTAFNASPLNAPPNTTYTWTLPVISPAGTITGASNALYQQPALSEVLENGTSANATAVYTAIAKNTGCVSAPFKATVTVLPTPRMIVAGNRVVCRYPSDTLVINLIGNPLWSFTCREDNNAPRTLSAIAASPFNLILPSSPLATRTFTFYNVGFGSCLNTKDTFYSTEIINPVSTGKINTQSGIYLCNNMPDTLFITSPDSLSYRWVLNNTTIPNATDDSLVTFLPGRYNAYITNKFGCVDTLPEPVTLIKVNQPILKFMFDAYCINTNLHFINLTDTNTTGPIDWSWNFGEGTVKKGYHSNIIYTQGGNHHIQLLASQFYCPATPTLMDSTIDIQIPIPGVTMPSVSAYKTVPKPISVRSIPGYRYRWTPSKGIDRPDSANVNFDYTNTQQYVINLISPAGCITNDSLLVRVFDDKLVDIFVPRSFTPNGDGINDVLYPYLTGIKTFQYFKVFNRFGQVMFETTNPDVGWNGSFNGTAQPMNIYIWVAKGITTDGQPIEKRGEVLLLR